MPQLPNQALQPMAQLLDYDKRKVKAEENDAFLVDTKTTSLV
jgi:hypothetical protein